MQSLLLFSRTPTLREIISSFADTSYFWYKRTEYLVGTSLESRGTDFDWREVYYKFQHLDVHSDPRRQMNILTYDLLSSTNSVAIALELGYKPEKKHLYLSIQGGNTDAARVLLDYWKDTPADDLYFLNDMLLQATEAEDEDIMLLLLNSGKIDESSRGAVLAREYFLEREEDGRQQAQYVSTRALKK